MTRLEGFSIPANAAEARSLAATIGPRTQLPASADEARAASQQEFASILSQSVAAKSGGAGSKHARDMTAGEKTAQARQAAEDFVAIAFVQPIFKHLRESHIGGELPPPFGPGPGEKQFRTLADTQVARKLVQASKWPLVDSITKLLSNGPQRDQFSAEALKNAPKQPYSPAALKPRDAAPTEPAKTVDQTPPRGKPFSQKTQRPAISLDTTIPARPHALADAEAAPAPIAFEKAAERKPISLAEPTPQPFSLRKAKQ